MKKIVLVIAGALLFGSANAQQKADEKYTIAIQSKLAAIDTMRKAEDLLALSAAFERIAEAEQTKWLPYYYAALTQVNAAYMLGMENMKAEQTDPMADKAEAMIGKANALQPDNSEIYVVKKMIASLRMLGDPMNRYMQYGPMAEEALKIAMKLNPENPRIYLLQAQDKFYTPEQFGGSKEEAKQLFEMALKKYATFKPASELEPTWGKPSVDYHLSQMSK